MNKREKEGAVYMIYKQCKFKRGESNDERTIFNKYKKKGNSK